MKVVILLIFDAYKPFDIAVAWRYSVCPCAWFLAEEMSSDLWTNHCLLPHDSLSYILHVMTAILDVG